MEPTVLMPIQPKGKSHKLKVCILFISSIVVDCAEIEQNTTYTMDTDTNSTVDIAPVNVTITAPPEVFNVSSDEVGYVLTLYPTPNLFQVKVPEGTNQLDFEFVTDSAVVGLTINRNSTELNTLTEPVVITLQSLRALSGQVLSSIFMITLVLLTICHILLQNWSRPICVSWNFSAANGTNKLVQSLSIAME